MHKRIVYDDNYEEVMLLTNEEKITPNDDIVIFSRNIEDDADKDSMQMLTSSGPCFRNAKVVAVSSGWSISQGMIRFIGGTTRNRDLRSKIDFSSSVAAYVKSIKSLVDEHMYDHFYYDCRMLSNFKFIWVKDLPY